MRSAMGGGFPLADGREDADEEASNDRPVSCRRLSVAEMRSTPRPPSARLTRLRRSTSMDRSRTERVRRSSRAMTTASTRHASDAGDAVRPWNWALEVAGGFVGVFVHVDEIQVGSGWRALQMSDGRCAASLRPE